ncbi:MAG: hypothetical protein O7G85_17520, partial [Planctomycetota bacterium]|nr:hypothetical protein [Planctomycetota bacterium]
MGGEEFGERQEQMIDSSQARADKYQTIMQMEGEELKEFEERREQMIDSSRARADKYQTIMQMEGEELGEHDRKIEDLSERREQMIDSTRARVDGILGLRLAARLALEEEGGTPDESDQESTVIVNGGGNDHAIQIERLSMDISEPETETDSYLPLPIGAGRINEYARRLGLAIEQGSILQSFYDDYRSGYDELLLDANSEEVSSTDEDPLSDARQRLERAKRRESRYEAIRVLDDDFFDQVSLLVDSDDQDARLESLRQERRRESASRGLTSWIQRFTDHDEALIDVPALVRGLEFSTEQSNRVLSALDEHNDALSATYEESTPIVLDHMRLRALGRALDEEGGQTPQALDNRIEQRFASLAKNARGLVELNRATIEQLKTLLSESDKWRLVQAYNEKVYPDIYWDDESAMDMFDTALALPDLGGGQHDDIQLIANNYRDQYYDLSDQLVDIASQRNGFEFQGVIPMDLIRRELKGERVKFQRRETSARARARLRILLNDEQTRLMRQIIREKEDEDDEEDS